MNELLKKIKEIIDRSPYTKEEVIALFAQEDELTDHEIIMLGTALEYAQKYNDPNTQNIRKLYLKKLDEIKEYYGVRESKFISTNE